MPLSIFYVYPFEVLLLKDVPGILRTTNIQKSIKKFFFDFATRIAGIFTQHKNKLKL